jgi:hypothetical protein
MTATADDSARHSRYSFKCETSMRRRTECLRNLPKDESIRVTKLRADPTVCSTAQMHFSRSGGWARVWGNVSTKLSS